MARYQIAWSPDVLRDFVNQGIKSTPERRRRLTEIANLVDSLLAQAPEELGVVLPAEPGLRVWKVPGSRPTGIVTLEVFESDRLVRVIRLTVGG